MKDGMSITLEGERELFLKMEYRLEGCEKAGRRGLRKGALKIVNDAKGKLKSNGSVVTGMLRASGKVQAVEGDPDAVDAGFFSQDTKGGYAYFVEYGTRAGGKRTIKFLLPLITQWMRKKGIKGIGMDFKSVAYFIARKIVRQGTRPHPFFGPAVEANKNAVNEFIAEEVEKETKRDGK